MSIRRMVDKVVIPVAGMGTRFLPATKVIPKELLPIVDKPIIHHIVSEAVEAGLQTVVLVTSRPKVLIEDYFDPADLTSFKLADAKKSELIESTLALSKKIDIISIRQYSPQGLGHAILQAEPVVRGSSFAVILGDDIVVSKNSHSAIGQCLSAFREHHEGSVIGVLPVDDSEVSKYGVAEVDSENQITRFIEKPRPEETQSRLALPGRYVFEPEIIYELKNTPRGKGNELQLTDAMERLRQKRPFYASILDCDRYDTGDKLGYIKANVSFALKNPELRPDLLSWLRKELLKEGPK